MNENDHDPRLEEAVAFALGSLDPEQIDDFKDHLQGCKRCQDELTWLAPAVRALPEAVEARTPPPGLKARLMAEVREDAEAEQRRAKAEQRRERAAGSTGFGEWLRGLHVGSLTWKPLAGMAVVLVIIAGGIGFAVGTGGGSDHTHTYKLEASAGGVGAEVVREGKRPRSGSPTSNSCRRARCSRPGSRKKARSTPSRRSLPPIRRATRRRRSRTSKASKKSW